MSWDISLCDDNGETVLFDKPLHFSGGTYAVGGTSEAWLNVTYNYSAIFYRVIDAEQGIRILDGMTAQDSLSLLATAFGKLDYDYERRDYWEPTEGNAKQALIQLLAMACIVPPQSKWRVT
jgi:hypothetical protein